MNPSPPPLFPDVWRGCYLQIALSPFTLSSPAFPQTWRLRPAKRVCTVRRCCLCSHSVALCSFTMARLQTCGRAWGAHAHLSACLMLTLTMPGPPTKSHPLRLPQHVSLSQTGLRHASRCLPEQLLFAPPANRGCLTRAVSPQRSLRPLFVLGSRKAAGTQPGNPPWGQLRKSERRNRGARAIEAPSSHKHPVALRFAMPSPGPIKATL